MTKEHVRNYKDVAMRLSSLLKRDSLSRSDLARQFGVTPSLITQKMTGKTAFTLSDVVMASDLFNVSTDWLLGREEAQQ